jgi:hypothetical protein
MDRLPYKYQQVPPEIIILWPFFELVCQENMMSDIFFGGEIGSKSQRCRST